MNTKTALITGVNGMDGSHLADLLLSKGYDVHGTMRRHTNPSGAMKNIEHLKDRITIHVADMTDQTSLQTVIKVVDPAEIYNLAAQSFVGSSWAIPTQTAEVNALGVCNLLEAARTSADPRVRIYQASTSEMFGKQSVNVANENTRFYPRSPYGVAKLYAHWLCVNYRESYGMHISCGILFNHESERRGEEFVTQKIATGVAKIAAGLADHIELGNTQAQRDWGYSPDYVDAMWRMVQQYEPGDFVIGTGESHSVQDFLREALDVCGLLDKCDYLEEEHCFDYSRFCKYNPKYARPAEVDYLKADASKAKAMLDWKPTVEFEDLVKRMVNAATKRLEIL